jgi:hypothetical protein
MNLGGEACVPQIDQVGGGTHLHHEDETTYNKYWRICTHSTNTLSNIGASICAVPDSCHSPFIRDGVGLSSRSRVSPIQNNKGLSRFQILEYPQCLLNKSAGFESPLRK